jgi:hypothetical protein
MKEHFSQGITFEGIVSTCGLIICLVGILGIVALRLVFPGIAVIITGLVLFVALKGVVIDYDARMVKPYYNFLLFKVGRWLQLNNYSKLELRLFTESQTMNMVSISNTYTTKTFNIYLRGAETKEILLKEFQDYEKAKLFLKEYSGKLNLEAVDVFEMIIERRDGTSIHT